MANTDVVAFVLTSAARRAVVDQLTEGSADSATLVAETTTSQSATYDAINRLQDQGLIVSTDDDCWSLTALGWMVGDLLDRATRLNNIAVMDCTFWETHDLSGLPERFRRQLDQIDGCSIIESPDPDPYRAARRLKQAIEDATEYALILAPVYDYRRTEAMLESEVPDRRVVMTPALARRLLEDDPDQPEGPAGFPIRVAPVGASMVATESEVLFSLPVHGEDCYDDSTVVHAEGDEAVDWGRRLFEHHWEGAPAVESYVAEQWPDLLSEVNVE